MSELEYYNKLDEVIDRFKNGKELYKKNASFNMIVQMLAKGENPYDVIEGLVKSNEDIQSAFTQYTHRDTRPILHNGVTYEVTYGK